MQAAEGAAMVLSPLPAHFCGYLRPPLICTHKAEIEYIFQLQQANQARNVIRWQQYASQRYTITFYSIYEALQAFQVLSWLLAGFQLASQIPE